VWWLYDDGGKCGGGSLDLVGCTHLLVTHWVWYLPLPLMCMWSYSPLI
jgi:hypothetical protein